MLQEEMHRSRRSFKQTLNATLRLGLTGKVVETKTAPFVVKARGLGLRAGIDPTSFNKLADEMEVDAFLAKTKGGRK